MNNQIQEQLFTHHQVSINQRIVLLAMLFVSCLIISNLTAFKVCEIKITNAFALDFPAASMFFPLTYFFDDALTEVYGFKISRLVIWGGLICSALITLCTSLAVYMPAAPIWDMQTHQGSAAYALVFSGSIRIFCASLIAYFFGEFLNSIILAKLKVFTHGKHLYLRILASTLLGVGIDTILFCNLAFRGLLPNTILWRMILTLYIFKVGYEIIIMPLTYYLISYLKRADKIDYFDTHTKFNPFSIILKR